MAASIKTALRAAPFLGLALVLLVSLKLMSDATSNSENFDRLYSLLLLVNLVTLVSLAGLIAVNLYRLVRQLRQRVMGSRLTARMLVMFVVLAVTPVVVVYYFSLEFLHRGIDNWFDVRIERALTDALELSRTALDTRMRELSRQTEQLAEELGAIPTDALALSLDEMRQRSGASELAVFSPSGGILASSSIDPITIVPNKPDEAVLLQVRQSGRYIGLDPIPKVGLRVRIVVRIPELISTGDSRSLQTLYPFSKRVNELAENVQTAFGHYRELAYLRQPLKQSFTLTLSLVLLLSILSAVWAAFFSARRLAAPIRDLAQGTRAVADGNYETQLPLSGTDELGMVVESFNDMTRRLSKARDEARHSQREVEEQRTYLQAILERMSSGMVTLDDQTRLYTTNRAASQILRIDINRHTGRRLKEIGEQFPNLSGLTETIERHLNDADWRDEITLFGPDGRQVLLCRGTPLTGMGEHVIVFDDITALVQAQRDAAWSEVARRLAHEIKNPLTPIQLSAERLRHKYLNKMKDGDRELLERLTGTIINQVDAMKEMVNAFSSYARTPRMNPEPMDLNKLVTEVLELYRYNKGDFVIDTDLDPAMPLLDADPVKLRQVLHNLVKNALEAPGEVSPRRVVITTRCTPEGVCDYLDVSVEDNGSGFPKEILEQAFEPYVSTKSRGSGLGLAIVKKIVEEHGGMARVENTENGARLRLRFPAHLTVVRNSIEREHPKEAS